MNESSNPKTMYEAVPAVAELNKVPGFDPLKFLRRTKDTLKLDLPYQKLWFRIGMCIAPIFGAERVTRPKSACVSCVSTGNIWPRTTGVSNRVPNVSLTEISARSMCGKIMWLPT